MKNSHDYAAQSDPGCNPNFRRQWGKNPLCLPAFKHLGRDVAPKVVQNVGRRAISHWLDKASEARGAPAAEAFRQADAIRRKLGLAWTDLIEQRSAA